MVVFWFFFHANFCAHSFLSCAPCCLSHKHSFSVYFCSFSVLSIRDLFLLQCPIFTELYLWIKFFFFYYSLCIRWFTSDSNFGHFFSSPPVLNMLSSLDRTLHATQCYFIMRFIFARTHFAFLHLDIYLNLLSSYFFFFFVNFPYLSLYFCYAGVTPKCKAVP